MPTTTTPDREIFDLGWTALQAIGAVSPRWIESVLGDWRSWTLRHREYSEFSILNPLRPYRLTRYLTEAAIPGVWRPTGVFKHPDHRGDYDSHPDEKWFFINGVLTNRDVAKINARLLARLFHRPMTVIHNSTNSAPVDLLESAVGKTWQVMTEPAKVAYPLLLEALKDKAKERVIVICHSQGTIIMANLLRALTQPKFFRWLFSKQAGADSGQADLRFPRRPRKQWLSKLEIYAFSNCADQMTYLPGSIRSAQASRVPWIESFGNEFDAVARFGMLAENKEEHGIQIDGSLFIRRRAWGHLLNEHYLFAIQDHLSQPSTPEPFTLLPTDGAGAKRPRLYDYFAGHRPPPY